VNQLIIQDCDIGEVIEWGTPKSDEKIRDFWNYMATPWRIVKKNKYIPDTILIDGRFRVASFLISLLSARQDAIILFDDYSIRPEYFVVEEFCKIIDKREYMVAFSVSHNYDISVICEKIAQYSVIQK